MALTDAQQAVAVALVQQLVSAGVVSLQQALDALCVRPLRLLWTHGWDCVQSMAHLRLLLLLVQQLLNMQRQQQQQQEEEAAGNDTAATAIAAACACPLWCDASVVQHADTDTLRWLVLGLCGLQQLLQEAAWDACRPEFRAGSQAAAVLEALVSGMARVGVSLRLLDVERAGAGLSMQELLRLSWPQRLLVCRVVAAASDADGAADERQQLLQPDSTKQLDCTTATAAGWQPLLDCCRMAAASEACAQQLLQALQQGKAADAPPAAAAPLDGVAASLARAACRLSGPAALKRELTLALGQFLPWASEAQAARMLLQLAPALLAASGTAAAVAQQPPQERQLAQHGGAVMQLAAKATVLFLLHGKWPRTQAQQGGRQPSAASAAALQPLGAPAQAKQLAAEQCFRHLSTLGVHAMQQGGAAEGDGGVLRACIQETCGTVQALAGAFDCAALGPVLLQLMLQLLRRSLVAAARPDSAAADATSWADAQLAGGTTATALLQWLGARLAQLPAPMQGMLRPAALHAAEQQLSAGVLGGRALSGEEVHALEAVLLA
jgi:hypothetical protein